MIDQPFEKIFHVLPPFLPTPVENSWEEESYLVKNLILPADQAIYLMVHKFEVYFE